MSIPKEKWINSIICSDALTALKNLPDQSVNCIITSPSYYKQRDYATNFQIGNEESPEEYIHRLVNVFAECKRVLTKDGTLWLNIGDKYINGDLLGLPWRVVLALKEQEWHLRSDIIWHKPNAMPTSVKSRPTTDHEYIFLLTRDKKYYYDIDAIREPHITFSKKSRMKGGRNHFGKKNGTPEKGKNEGNPNLHRGRWDQAFHPKGRNRRTVWEIPLSKFRGVHFAVFPEKLVETCILAGCPQDGIVLDPFMGSGTTAVVAKNLGRNYLGIDSNEEYCQLARNRLKQGTLFSTG